MTDRWEPERYLAYADERGRPFLDLVGRVDAVAPHEVVDLGCGPGNLTALLARRWPKARVRGVDASPEMVERARHDHPALAWEVADLRDWLAAGPGRVDVVVTNATPQWVPGHLELLPGVLGVLAPGGSLALQVPGNFGEPSHVLLRELAAEPAYAMFTTGVATPAAHGPEVYFDTLSRAGAQVDAWETTYLHVLDATADPDPVFTWISATGARPVLQALPDDLRAAFEAEYRTRLRAAYPVREGRVVLPFRRVFAVARVSS